MWRTIEADGCTWEVRAVASAPDAGAGEGEELLEFRASDANRPPRRVVVSAGPIDDMSEDALRSAYLRARPIGGDHYGRPGKRMGDAG